MDGPTGPQDFPAQPGLPGHRGPRARPDRRARRGGRCHRAHRPQGIRAWTAPPGRRDFRPSQEPPGHRGPRAPPDRQARKDARRHWPHWSCGWTGEDLCFYYSDVRSVPNNGQIPLYELLNDPTGNITLSGTQQLALQPGYYRVSTRVSHTGGPRPSSDHAAFGGLAH